MTTVTFPWPAAALSQNGRHHWRQRASATKKARRDAFWLCGEAGLRDLGAVEIAMRFTFHPPDKRRRDVANAIGACKAMIDGIADATGCDDSRFRIAWPDRFAEVQPRGAVVVEFGE